MFVSQERGTTRKPFQKPNILRRKPKVVRWNAQKSNGSSDITRLVPPTNFIEQSQGEPSQTFQIVQAPSFNVVGYSQISDGDASQTLQINGDSITIYAHDGQTDVADSCTAESTLNVESFLNNGIDQTSILLNIDGTLAPAKIQNDDQQKWSINFINEESKDNFVNYYDGSQINSIYIDKSADAKTAVEEESTVPLQTDQDTSQNINNVPTQNIALECLNMSSVVKFKCDIPNCNKSFWTEDRLQKHKSVHDKQKSTQSVFECPVNKAAEDGVKLPCGRTFLVRSQLMKHLNEEHSPEDALYRCTKCGRSFFYAAGARAHVVSSCTAAYTCGWAGCGRVFRQLCRLREHARAHTGDRPYPCRYPNCGWAFRSASKLMRHARRHTGERRHECTACGRAYPRREHLRDHIARHHDAQATPTATSDATLHDASAALHDASDALHDASATLQDASATQESTTVAPVISEDGLVLGSDQTYAVYLESMNTHIKEIKSKNTNKKPATKRALKNTKAKKNMFVVPIPDPKSEMNVTLKPEEVVERPEAVEQVESGEEGRCARTHCTWPLQRHQHQYILEDDAQAEQSESCESNIYTVRSDLFLHGNLLVNDDSEFIVRGGAEGAGEGGGVRGEGGALDSPLGLIDSHPTIDLMQEELMYADAVDESAFRVLLLNGEELT